MERLWRDRRGVTVQIGAILLFGILVLALATYQAVVVPIENERVEFNHNQQVQSDMLDLRSAVLEAGTTTGFQSVSVRLGTTYPSRVFLVNPPAPSGRLGTGPQRNASFGNITATDDETSDFLNTSTNGRYNLSTRAVSYRPDYNEYDSAPVTTLQSGTTVNVNPRGNNTTLGGQTIVRGSEIYLVTVAGSLSVARPGTVVVNPESLSTATRPTTVTNTSAGNVTVTVPTALSAGRWRTLLNDEYDPGFDDSGHVYAVSDVPGRDAVKLSLDGGVTYRLRTALVGVGSVGAAPGPAYVTAVDGDDDITIETRDRFNNAVANSRVADDLFVNATENRSLLADPRVAVGEDGRAAFAFDSTATSDDAPATVEFTLEDGSRSVVVPGTPGNATVRVEKSDLPANESGGDSPTADSLAADEVAFDDANGNGEYESSETAYTETDLDANGATGPNGEFSGQDIVVTKDVSVSKLDLTARSLTAQNVEIEATNAGNDLKIETDRGIDLRESTVRSPSGGKVDLGASQGTNGFDIDIRDTKIVSENTPEASTPGGKLRVNKQTGSGPGTRIVRPDGSGRTLKLEDGNVVGPGVEKGDINS